MPEDHGVELKNTSGLRQFYFRVMHTIWPFSWIHRLWWKLFPHPNQRTEWKWELNTAQLGKNYDAGLDQFYNYGIAGGEVWSEQTGYCRMDWTRGKMVWERLWYTGRYWIGTSPEDTNGKSISKKEFQLLKKKFRFMYDT